MTRRLRDARSPRETPRRGSPAPLGGTRAGGARRGARRLVTRDGGSGRRRGGNARGHDVKTAGATAADTAEDIAAGVSARAWGAPCDASARRDGEPRRRGRVTRGETIVADPLAAGGAVEPGSSPAALPRARGRRPGPPSRAAAGRVSRRDLVAAAGSPAVRADVQPRRLAAPRLAPRGATARGGRRRAVAPRRVLEVFCARGRDAAAAAP